MPRRVGWTVRAARIACAIALLLASAGAQRLELGTPREIVPGLLLYHLTDPALLDPPAPISIWLLRLDPARVRLRAALANDEIMGTETVAGIAERRSALAAINAGLFTPNGDPVGVLTIDHRLVSDARRAHGAVGIIESSTGPQLIFARLRASVWLTIGTASTSIQIDGVDTTRAIGRLMLFTPAYHTDTDTAPGGLEWTLAGNPLRVEGQSRTQGKTPIPPDGFVLSFGGKTPPAALRALRRGARVTLDTIYEPVEGRSDAWARADHIVSGAGLLLLNGRMIDDWSIEGVDLPFSGNRHPRTMIGTAADGAIWLVTVDGRQPRLSAGMALAELRALAQRLDLVDALNLDGGGSTTMWIDGAVVNSPSDVTGPRKVSDALLVCRGRG
jgi:Phosphodiester glycosidase